MAADLPQFRDRKTPDTGWIRILDTIQGCLQAVEAVMAEDDKGGADAA